jgi:hypothetical protein
MDKNIKYLIGIIAIGAGVSIPMIILLNKANKVTIKSNGENSVIITNENNGSTITVNVPDTITENTNENKVWVIEPDGSMILVDKSLVPLDAIKKIMVVNGQNVEVFVLNTQQGFPVGDLIPY